MEIYKSFIICFGEKTLEPKGLYTDNPMDVIKSMACDGATYVAILDEYGWMAYEWDKQTNEVVHRTSEQLDW